MSVLGRRLRLSINPALIDKNEAKDDSLFKSGWQNEKLTPIELAARINEGVAYCCELSGSRRAANFVASDLLSVDVDGTGRIPDLLAHPLVEQHLTILYTTVRHTERSHRFRLGFALPRSIETAREMVAASRSLSLRLSGDLAATDAARIFFGSRGSNPMVFDRCMDEALLDELIAQGLDADRRDSIGPNSANASTVSRLSIAPDLVVRRPSGEPVSFTSLNLRETLCCPFHADTNASAFTVQSTTNGAIGLYCSTCRQSFWPSASAYQRYEFFDFDRQVEEAHRYFEANTDMGAIHKFLFDESNPRRAGLNHLPRGAYAVIGSGLRDDQIDLVNELLDRLKQHDVAVFDQRDVDRQRYDRALGRWHEAVVNEARSMIRETIAREKGARKAKYGIVGVIDDELKIDSGSTENDLRATLKFLGHDGADIEAVFEEARQRVPMPEVPKSLLSMITTDEELDELPGLLAPIDRKKFDSFS